MKYISTRKKTTPHSMSQAMQAGLAPDGGLFIPEQFPTFDVSEFTEILSYPEFCAKLLKPFFHGDPLASKLDPICKLAFNFDLPLKKLNESTYLMELFHGPTLSFKDFGARFLAACLSEIIEENITIMVATSGDTGSAVAAAFHKKAGIEVIVLFPDNQISQRQQQQITCWGDNVHPFAVEGTFDDCQHLVKSAFSDPEWNKNNNLCTANSINIGRLLPQVCYYAFTSLQLFKTQNIQANFIVPSGNLGNVTAAYWAKILGFPIDKIMIATNANRVVSDYLATSHFQPRKSIPTLANAMDVGNPSNFERLIALFSDFKEAKEAITAYSVTDAQIKETIKSTFNHYKTIICPHTATGCWARNQMSDQDTWIIAATADPCKFESIVEPIIEEQVPMTEEMAKMLSRPNKYTLIKPKLELISRQIGNE